MASIRMVILAHDDEPALEDTVANIRHFCPAADLALYNSGGNPHLGEHLSLDMAVPSPQRLSYAKVTPFFFDVFESLAASECPFDYFINLETDMLFIRRGFERFIASTMAKADYMAPEFRRFTSSRSRWRPIRSLRPELPAWYELLGSHYTHRAFSPGQVFSRRYVEALVDHPRYPAIKALVDDNQAPGRSFSLQEVLLPTLVDLLGVRAISYPDDLRPVNRYRPYQAVSGIRRALALPHAFFVHPVRRQHDDPARRFVRRLWSM